MYLSLAYVAYDEKIDSFIIAAWEIAIVWTDAVQT